MDKIMKTSKWFWGIMFLTLGILLLINNFIPIEWNWGAIWKLWPLALILFGVNLFFKDSKLRWIIASANGLLIGLILFSSIDGIHDTVWGDNCFVGYRQDTQSWQPSIKTAELHMEAGAGKIYIDGISDSLYENSSKGVFSFWDTERNDSGDHTTLSVEMRNQKGRNNSNGIFKSESHIKLNANPIWDINLEIGAATFNADLTPFKIHNIKTSCGASSLKYRIGDKCDTTSLDFETGASSLHLEIPKTSGCRVMSEAALSGKHFQDFKEVSNNVYETENFGSSSKKVLIHYEGGVSSITVKRY
jgi:hypothetical protein